MKLMKSLKYVGIVLFFMALASCSDAGKETNKETTKGTDTKKVYPVRIQKIRKQNIERTLEYTANLVAFEEINYAPASPGRIHKINVEVGDRVKKGQLLVEIDKTQLTQALTQLSSAQSSFERIDTLYKLGSISEQQYEQAETQYELARSNVNFLKENTTLLSPINGIVTGKYFENGEFYSGTPNTAAGKAAVISLMQINPLKAVVSISEMYFPDIKKGMKASVSADVYPDEIFEGSIYKVYPTIDKYTRTFQTEILIGNNSEQLRPGMFARIEIRLGEAKALVVPAISILKQEGTNNRYVFINENGVAKQVDVKLGKRFDDKVELISKDIQEGMELIVNGQANLIDGSKVKVVK
jgi:membrane fusion protein, multidrug efflux system